MFHAFHTAIVDWLTLGQRCQVDTEVDAAAPAATFEGRSRCSRCRATARTRKLPSLPKLPTCMRRTWHYFVRGLLSSVAKDYLELRGVDGVVLTYATEMRTRRPSALRRRHHTHRQRRRQLHLRVRRREPGAARGAPSRAQVRFRASPSGTGTSKVWDHIDRSTCSNRFACEPTFGPFVFRKKVEGVVHDDATIRLKDGGAAHFMR